MKITSFALIFLAVFCSARSQQYDFSAIDRLLQDSLLKLGRGAALVLIEDEKIIYAKAFGKYSVDSVVPIASASKWYSGAVIMSLVDEGKLSLDDRIDTFFPGLPEAKARITIRQLFSHTSGIDGDAPCLGNDNTTLEECTRLILEMPLQYSPGTMFVYGGSSMQVAGRIAEIVSGMPWDTLFRRRIAEPLGMVGTHYDGMGVTDNPRIPGGAASSGADYARFMTMILNGGTYKGRRVLSENAVMTMMEDQTLGAPIIYSPYTEYGDVDPDFPQARYGIGVWREKTDSEGKLVEAASPGAFGFSPWVDQQRRYAGVLSVHGLMQIVVPTYVRLKQLLRTIIPLDSSVSSAHYPEHEITGNVRLRQNYPNPFSSTSTISFYLPSPGHVTLRIYDLLGRETATLINEKMSAGDHDIQIHAAMSGHEFMTAGTYICRLETAWGRDSRVMRVE